MKHYIIVKFKKDTDWKAMLPDIQKVFDKALLIEGVSGVSLYPSNSLRANRYDLMIELNMTPEGLERYDVSEMHREWKRDYGAFIEAKTIFDCD